MNVERTRAHITISVADLENMLRRVVREAVHQEFARLAGGSRPPLLDDWSQEGPEDPAGDEHLLQEALVTLEAYGSKPESWLALKDLETELDRAKAAGELPG